ncbi:MAG: hypothetical protein H7338_09765 [Candidatus Sericytochromatia bacterium]|nr:hypothetical protein [Candidatus Sericytochromatia bacterium]
MSSPITIERPGELSLRSLMQAPSARDLADDRIVVSKWGFEVAQALNFAYEPIDFAGEVCEVIRFEVRLNNSLLAMVGSMMTTYATFVHSDVEIRPRFDEAGQFGVTATVTPRRDGDAAEALNASIVRLADGSTRFTLVDPRWRGQSVTLHPRRGSLEVVGVLSRSHKLTGKYSRRRF